MIGERARWRRREARGAPLRGGPGGVAAGCARRVGSADEVSGVGERRVWRRGVDGTLETRGVGLAGRGRRGFDRALWGVRLVAGRAPRLCLPL